MRKLDDLVQCGYMDAKKWREIMRVESTKKIDVTIPSSDKEDKENYKVFADEISRVRQFISAYLYNELQETSLTGKQIMQFLDLRAERYARMKEPPSGEEVIVGNYAFNSTTMAARRKSPEALYITLEQLYKLGYYIFNRSCQSILLGTEDAIRLPNIYNCLFSQYGDTPRRLASKIGRTIQSECKGNAAYLGTATMSGESESKHFISMRKNKQPVDYQEIFIDRLREKIEDRCCFYGNIFGTDANNIARKMAKRCFKLDTKRNREVFESFLPTKNGEIIEDDRRTVEPTDACTISTLMILSMLTGTAADYYVAPDYTRYAPLLMRTNEIDEITKKPVEVELDKEERNILSALLLCDNQVKDDIISSMLSDLWLAQYMSLAEKEQI